MTDNEVRTFNPENIAIFEKSLKVIAKVIQDGYPNCTVLFHRVEKELKLAKEMEKSYQRALELANNSDTQNGIQNG